MGATNRSLRRWHGSCSNERMIEIIAALMLGPDGGIAWYGTWERGLAAAKSTGRPILLISAAPQCHGVSGLW